MMDGEQSPAGDGGKKRKRFRGFHYWIAQIWTCLFGNGSSEILRADYNRNFCRQLKSEFASFLESESPDPAACQEFRALIDRLEGMLRKEEALDERQTALAELFEAEMLLLRAMPEDAVRAKVWSCRSTYRKLVGEALYQQYLDSKPIDAKTDDIAKVRADVIDLTKGRHWWYLNAIVMEHGIRSYQVTLKHWLVGGFICLLLLNLCLAIHVATVYGGARHAVYGRTLSVILMTVYAGMLGAAISIARRVKDASSVPLSDTDPVIRLSTIVNGDIGVELSMIIGATCALVWYFLCVAGIAEQVITVNLLPKFMPACDPTKDKDCNEIVQTFSSLIPYAGADLAKLLIWCFIAGFAEKFVPDILDKLASAKQNTTATPARP